MPLMKTAPCTCNRHRLLRRRPGISADDECEGSAGAPSPASTRAQSAHSWEFLCRPAHRPQSLATAQVAGGLARGAQRGQPARKLPAGRYAQRLRAVDSRICGDRRGQRGLPLPQRLDSCEGAGEKPPVLVWIHGGGFRAVPHRSRSMTARSSPKRASSSSASITASASTASWRIRS